MPYTETHTIEIGPILLPDGVSVEVTVPAGSGGQQAVSASEVDLAWSASSDSVAVAEYVIVYNGIKIATVPASSASYHDATVVTGTAYSYTVLVVDTIGNVSAPSNAAAVTTP